MYVLFEESELRTQESALTGESTSVSKDAPTILSDDALIQERINMAYMGTSAVRGVLEPLSWERVSTARLVK